MPAIRRNAGGLVGQQVARPELFDDLLERGGQRSGAPSEKQIASRAMGEFVKKLLNRENRRTPIT
jgi:hypothetical protein